MASERIRLMVLVALATVAVYLLDGWIVTRYGSGVARMVVLMLALGMAGGVPLIRAAQEALWQRTWRPRIEELRIHLAIQTSARGVAEVLVTTLHRLLGAHAVVCYLEADQPLATSGKPKGPPSLTRVLMASERPIGEVRCYGKLHNQELLDRVLRFGALAMQNALLAEQASEAERAHLQAQAQRDLQYRLTWTVTTQLCALLEETRSHLETVRLCSNSMPPDLLVRDFDILSDRLYQLEAFVQDNLRNVNAGSVPFFKSSACSLAPSPLA